MTLHVCTIVKYCMKKYRKNEENCCHNGNNYLYSFVHNRKVFTLWKCYNTDVLMANPDKQNLSSEIVESVIGKDKGRIIKVTTEGMGHD